MEAGQISENELSQTKAMLTNAYKETQDSAFDIINFDFTSQYFNVELTIEDIIAMLERTTIDDVVQVAKKVNLNTIYFLKNKEVQPSGSH